MVTKIVVYVETLQVGQRHLNVCIKKFYKSDFIYIESTLNASKVSTFKVLNKFWENKMSKCGISVHFHSVSFSVALM